VRGQHYLESKQEKASAWPELSLASQSTPGLPRELCLGLALVPGWPLLPATRPELPRRYFPVWRLEFLGWALLSPELRPLCSVQALQSWEAAHRLG
jgi:hypothetical protein